MVSRDRGRPGSSQGRQGLARSAEPVVNGDRGCSGKWSEETVAILVSGRLLNGGGGGGGRLVSGQ